MVIYKITTVFKLICEYNGALQSRKSGIKEGPLTGDNAVENNEAVNIVDEGWSQNWAEAH